MKNYLIDYINGCEIEYILRRATDNGYTIRLLKYKSCKLTYGFIKKNIIIHSSSLYRIYRYMSEEEKEEFKVFFENKYNLKIDMISHH